MNLYYTICIKNVRIILIRIGMYEFILVNLYKKIIEKKDLHPVGISTRLEIVALYRSPPHPLRQWPFYLS